MSPFMDSFPKIKSSQLLPPFPTPSNSDSTSFPIIAIAIIAILATAFLLLTYYIFLINCCLTCHRTLPPANSPAIQILGLHESIIRSIPLLRYNKNNSMATEQSSSECAVCLSEFEEDETLRVIPICSHLFHIDCIDIWLQNNPNCPLCRTTISSSALFHPFPLSSPENPNSGGGERDFVVIEMGEIGDNPSGQFSQERPNSGELPAAVGKLEQGKKRRKMQKLASFGDGWIDMRGNDEGFCVEPIRRSVSMDSSAERRVYLAVQAAVQQSRRGSPGGDWCNGRGKRSLFSFGSGRSCRNAVHVQPVWLEDS